MCDTESARGPQAAAVEAGFFFLFDCHAEPECQPEPVGDAAAAAAVTRGAADDGGADNACQQAMSTPASAVTQVTVRDEAIPVRGDELQRLLDALARLGQRDADAVAEQIAALRLSGGVIRLTPTEAELAALELALAALAENDRSFGPNLRRLAADCADESPLAEALQA